jgi:hypothetical protein
VACRRELAEIEVYQADDDRFASGPRTAGTDMIHASGHRTNSQPVKAAFAA